MQSGNGEQMAQPRITHRVDVVAGNIPAPTGRHPHEQTAGAAWRDLQQPVAEPSSGVFEGCRLAAGADAARGLADPAFAADAVKEGKAFRVVAAGIDCLAHRKKASGYEDLFSRPQVFRRGPPAEGGREAARDRSIGRPSARHDLGIGSPWRDGPNAGFRLE